MPPPADREDPLEPLLRRALQGQRAAAEDCLDAETLAAVVDGRLPAEAADAAEAHVADCERCQATLAALVRSEPEPQPHVSWWRLPAVRWLAPATAVAAAALLWVAVDRDPRVLHVRQPVPEVSVPAPVAPPVANLGDTAPDTAASAAPDRERLPVARPSAPVAPTIPGNEMAPQAPPPPAELSTQAGPPASVPAAPPASPLAAHETLRNLPVPSPEAGRAAAFAPPRPVAGVTANAPVRDAADSALRTSTQAPAVVAEAVMVMRDVASSDPRYRWRLVGPGVQRSTDGGGTWQNQTTGTTAFLSAGSAVSPEVCWVVGDRGLVLVTVDGLSWQRVSAPIEQELVAVSATSADAATVTTRDGRSFATVDRGRTWTAQ